jgi:hypothetical protein
MKKRFGLFSALLASLFLLQGISAASGGSTGTIATFQQSSVSMKGTVGSSTTATVHLYDSYSPPLTINSITISGAQANEYTSSGTCAAGAVVQKGVPCTLNIIFTPQAVGTRTATLTANFANAASKSLALSGQSLIGAPVLNILSTYTNPINLGTRAVGFVPTSVTLADAFLQIADAGGSPLTISESVIGPNASDFLLEGVANKGVQCAPGMILNSANLPCNLPILFVPTAEGTRTATLRITSNDPARPVVDINLTGVGTPGSEPPSPPPPPPVVSVADFTDLWSVAGETNRNIEISHHKSTTDVLKAFWHTYDVDGRDMWLELSDGHWVDGLTYTGNLHRSRGTAFSLPDDPTVATDAVVGTATLTFTDAANGKFEYSVNGTTGSFTITRVVF